MKEIASLLCIISLNIACLFVLNLLPLSTPNASAGTCRDEQTILTIEPWYHDLCKDGTNLVTVESIPGFTTQLILNLISIALQVAGYIAVGFVIWGGIKYMLSTGEPSKIASAKNIITNALIGLLLCLAAVAIVRFISGLYA